MEILNIVISVAIAKDSNRDFKSEKIIPTCEITFLKSFLFWNDFNFTEKLQG